MNQQLPLRGRDELLSLIGERLAGTAVGRGGVVFVAGRPGFGKTALLRQAAAQAEGHGIRVGTASVTASDQVVPMGPFLSALFDGARPLVDPGERGKLHYLPEQRYWLLDEIEALLEQAALRSPVLVCLDDMQWADAGSLTALKVLPARLASLPIVWLVAYRAGEEAPGLRAAIDGLTRTGASESLLTPLDSEATAQIVADLTRARPDQALLELARRAHGSPFLLVELLHGLREEGLLRIESGRVTLLEARLPARVRDGMRDRLARMSPEAGRLARVAAVLGRTFTFDQLAVMLGTSPATLLTPVDELLTAELLSEHDGELEFRHDLLREAVLATLPTSAYRALQRQAVDALLETGAPPVEVAVALAASAVPGDRAAVRTLHDAAQALAASDPNTGAELGRRALELADAADPLRGPLAAQTVLLLHAAGRVGEGRDFAEGILRETLTVEQEGEVRLSIAEMIALAADTRVEAGRRALELPLSATLKARHLAGLVHNTMVAGRAAQVRALMPEAVEAVRASSDRVADLTLKLTEGALAYTDGDFRTAAECINTAARGHTGETPRAILAREWQAEVLAVFDRYDESLRFTAENQALAQRGRQGWAIRFWESSRGRQLFQVGRLSDAGAALEGAVEASEEVALANALGASAVGALGRVALHTGEPLLLKRSTAVMHRLAQSPVPAVRSQAAWLLALAAMAQGDLAGIREHLGPPDRPLLPLLPLDVTDEISLVRMALAIDDEALVRAGVEAAAARLARNPGVPSIAGTAAHTRALATGSPDDFAEAVRWFEQSPRQLALASAVEDAGRVAVAQSRRDEAVALLSDALKSYTHAGATWDASRVRGRLRELGVRRRLPASPARPERGYAALTPSELDVARLVAEGMTNRAVAEKLFVSTHTVSTHLRHVFTKLDINSRFELSRILAQHA